MRSRDLLYAVPDAGAPGCRGALLEMLVRTPGRLVSQQDLRVYVGGLRKKLEDDPSAPRHLITEPGMGYRFEV
jgi:two-component system, OmpR family, KDP operon response regulator KdpE